MRPTNVTRPTDKIVLINLPRLMSFWGFNSIYGNIIYVFWDRETIKIKK
jgi:hypothetical protein